MSVKSKRTIVSMVAGIILIAVYIFYARGKDFSGEDLKSWAVLMLVFIGISVAAMILINIVFHIVFAIGTAVKEREKSDSEVERIIESSVVEDEMDKIINLRSAQIGNICTGIGFIAALVTLAFGMPAVIALHVLFGSLAIGSIIQGGANVYFYEKGVKA